MPRQQYPSSWCLSCSGAETSRWPAALYRMGWPPFWTTPLDCGHSLLLVGSLFLLLPPSCSAPENNNGALSPWSAALVDQIRPYRLSEKRVHQQLDKVGSQWRRDRRVRADGPKEHELPPEWQLPAPEAPVTLDQIPTIGPSAEFHFLANQTLLHLRTPTYWLRHDQCLETHFRVEGKRTRLLLYTCRMAEGGVCVLDKFLATSTLKKLDPGQPSPPLDMCHPLQPWMFLASPFAFHFRFVRRPRRFADREHHLRHLRRRHGRHATREVGHVRLGGFRPCESACRGEGNNGPELDVPLADREHFEDPREGWRRRKRRTD